MGSVSAREELRASAVPSDITFVTQANDAGSVAGLVKEISALGDSAVDKDQHARLELLKKARSLVRSLETPRETMIKHLWAQPTATTDMAVMIEAGVFALMTKEDRPMKVEEMASTLNMDPSLLARQMRHVGAMGYVNEVAEDEYAPTNFTKSLAVPIVGDGYPCIVGSCFNAFSVQPTYYIQNGFQSPQDPTDGPLQRANKDKMNFFQWCQAHPPWGTYFNHHMGGYSQGRPSWMDPGFFPVQERLVEGINSADDAVLLVDVGGSLGHDLDEFRRKHPEAPGRLVLQDLPEVINGIKDLNPKIERMTHDFHTEQPVKGARAYYMHSVLHDWQDDVCDSILTRLREAMKPGYSKLLINENVIPGTEADWQATALDRMMMSLFTSKERTRADWEKLLTKNGFKIIEVHSKGAGVESLIECELA